MRLSSRLGCSETDLPLLPPGPHCPPAPWPQYRAPGRRASGALPGAPEPEQSAAPPSAGSWAGAPSPPIQRLPQRGSRLELRRSRPGPAWRGHLGLYGVGKSQASPGPTHPVRRPGGSVWVQRGGDAGYEGVLPPPLGIPPGGPLAYCAASPPRSGPPGPVGTHTHHPRHPEGNCNSSIFFAALFSDVFALFFFFCFFVFVFVFLEGRVGSGKANTKPTRSGKWEEGAAQARGPQSGEPGLASRGPRVRPPRPSPSLRRQLARVVRRGGQLLYWHALRPEAGPCRPP